MNGCMQQPQAFQTCSTQATSCPDFGLCLINNTTDGGMGGGAGGGGGATGGGTGGGSTGGGGGTQQPVPDVTSISCVDPNDNTRTSPGRQIRVTCPRVVNNMVVDGFCLPYP